MMTPRSRSIGMFIEEGEHERERAEADEREIELVVHLEAEAALVRLENKLAHVEGLAPLVVDAAGRHRAHRAGRADRARREGRCGGGEWPQHTQA